MKKWLSLICCVGLILGLNTPAWGMTREDNCITPSATLYLGSGGLYETYYIDNQNNLRILKENEIIATDVKDFSTQGERYSIIKLDNSLWMWGGKGLYGDVYEKVEHPVKIMDDVRFVIPGETVVVIRNDNSLWMWGDNSAGQLGTGNTKNSEYPVKTMDDVSCVTTIGRTVAAIKTDGTLWMWGDNSAGQCGNGGQGSHDILFGTNVTSPCEILENVTDVKIYGGYQSGYTYAISGGDLYGWGVAGNQLGEVCGDTERLWTMYQSVPAKILNNVKSVPFTNSAIRTDNSLWVWGVENNTPRKILDNVVSAKTDGNTYAAICTDGSLWMWGRNNEGQCGNGTAEDVPTPTMVLENVALVDFGYENTVAITNDNTLVTWGRNTYGELGIGSTNRIRVPTWAANDIYAVNCSVGLYSVFAVKTDGSIYFSGYGWGRERKSSYSVAVNSTTFIPLLPSEKVKITNQQNIFVIPAASAQIAHPSTQTVLVDGVPVTFHAYALKDENGNDTNYIKLRDVAAILNGSAAQFEVGWDGSITITTKTAYTPNGSENIANFSGDQSYTVNTSPVKINGVNTNLNAITLTDAGGGGYTYFKLRDLGTALGFSVDWNVSDGIIIQTQ